MGIHILLVQTLGMSRPMGVGPTKEISFFPDFILKDALGWLVVLGIIGAICVFLPWEVGLKADPFAPTPLGIKPEWYFTFMFTTLKVVPGHVFSLEGEVLAVLLFMLGGLLWMFIPMIDRRAAKDRKSPVISVIGFLIVVYIAVMTALTYLAPNL
jgi:cytochrome b6